MKNTKVKYSFAEWCKDNNREDLLDLWDYDLNECTPYDVSWGSERHCYFKCSRGLHESHTRQPCSLSRDNSSLKCKKCESIGQYLIDKYGEDGVETYWSEKNKESAFDIYKSSSKKHWFKCVNSMHPDYEMNTEAFSAQGCRCPICSHRKVVPGINDVATTHPQFVEHFLYPEDATKISAGSGKIVKFKCPLCGHKYSRPMHKATRFNCSCEKCSDGNSYPEKFVYDFLSQLKNKNKFLFESEKIFDWSKSLEEAIHYRAYDFYIEGPYSIIVEVHGEQHYTGAFQYLGGHTLEEEQENDLFKRNLAIQNGIKPENYIVIDARKSNMLWIKTSIMNSVLPKIFNFLECDIDWAQCEKFACGNIIKDACDLWNSGLRSTRLIGERLNRTKTAIKSYLKKGTNLGWCDYICSDLRAKSSYVPLICTDNNLIFSSVWVCEDYSDKIFGIHLKAHNIYCAMNGARNNTYGYHFKRITKEEFVDLKNANPDCVFGNVYFYDAYNFVG